MKSMDSSWGRYPSRRAVNDHMVVDLERPGADLRAFVYCVAAACVGVLSGTFLLFHIHSVDCTDLIVPEADRDE